MYRHILLDALLLFCPSFEGIVTCGTAFFLGLTEMSQRIIPYNANMEKPRTMASWMFQMVINNTSAISKKVENLFLPRRIRFATWGYGIRVTISSPAISVTTGSTQTVGRLKLGKDPAHHSVKITRLTISPAAGGDGSPAKLK